MKSFAGIRVCFFQMQECKSGQALLFLSCSKEFTLFSSVTSFMKDLATLRNPQSPITFLSYLHSQDRLISFINRGSTIPSRKEYADYLSWAARFVQNNGVDVLYGHEVIRLSKGSSDTIEIHSRNVTTGAERVVKARTLVVYNIITVLKSPSR